MYKRQVSYREKMLRYASCDFAINQSMLRALHFFFYNLRKAYVDVYKRQGLACEKVEWEKVKEGMICRMDIVHDEQYWFANLLLQLP